MIDCKCSIEIMNKCYLYLLQTGTIAICGLFCICFTETCASGNQADVRFGFWPRRSRKSVWHPPRSGDRRWGLVLWAIPRCNTGTGGVCRRIGTRCQKSSRTCRWSVVEISWNGFYRLQVCRWFRQYRWGEFLHFCPKPNVLVVASNTLFM